VAAESYPEELRYHPEHDWARIEGETATFGITWYAQDALGEVVTTRRRSIRIPTATAGW
jgi:glycine cleavage system H protein